MTATETEVVRLPEEPLRELDEDAAEAAEAAEDRGRGRRRVGFILLGVAALVVLFLVFEFMVSGLVYQRSQQVLLGEFQGSAEGGLASTIEWQPAEGDPVGIITIPRVALESVIVEGTRSSDTTNGPGHFRGSPLPGRPGNAVIMGRRSTFGSPFKHLDQLREGDRIQVATGIGLFTYLVDEVRRISPGQPDVLTSFGDTRLTLVTSDPPLAASGRLAVIAKPATNPAAEPPRPPVLIAPSETGLTGESSGAAGLLLWSQLMVIVGVGGIWIARGISRRVAWILAAPMIAALVWALFLAANRFLPATL